MARRTSGRDLVFDDPSASDIDSILEAFPFGVRCIVLSGLQIGPGPGISRIYEGANRAAGRLAGGENYSYKWASVTKLASTVAMLIAKQKYLLDLDTQAGPPGATIRHLLAHASGVDFSSDQVHSKPGLRRIYSNRGIEIAAKACEEATGDSFVSWIENEVLFPLDLSRTFLWGSPAWGMKGTIGDLAAFASELMMPSLLDDDSDRLFTTVQFPGLSGVVPGYGFQRNNAWALGAEIHAAKDPHWMSVEAPAETFGHFGQSGSFLWVDRRNFLAAVFMSEQPFGRYHRKLWKPLNYALHRYGLKKHGRVLGTRPAAMI